MYDYIIGCDPGLQGAYCVMDKNGVVARGKFPLVKIRKKHKGKMIDSKDYDFKRIAEIFEPYRFKKTLMIVEQIHSMFGVRAKAVFGMGRALGILEAISGCNHFELVTVTPKIWQKAVLTDITIEPIYDRTTKKYKTDTKGMALISAKHHFPDEDFLATKRSTTPSDGIVDAMLITHYGRNTYDFND